MSTVKEKLGESVAVLLSYFNEPKKWNSRNEPLVQLQVLIQMVKYELRKKEDPQLKKILKELDDMYTVFEAWMTLGYQSTFIEAKRKLENIRKIIDLY